jgi:hypothetical protein
MKKLKIVLMAAFIASLSLNTINLQAGSPIASTKTVVKHQPLCNAELIEKAKRAAEECLEKAQSPGTQINAQVEVISKCANGGEIRKVTFTKKPICPPGRPCPFFAIRVAEVDFGCNDEITSNQCFIK